MQTKPEKQMLIPVDAPRNIEEITNVKKGSVDTKVLKIDLKDYEILTQQQHIFINTLLQLSNQILGLRQQYQQHIAIIDDISDTIKRMRTGDITEILITKGGLFLIREKVKKKMIADLQRRRAEIINANNITIGQIQKNHAVFREYAKKIATNMAKYLEDKSEKEKIIEMEKEIDKEALELLSNIEVK